MEGRRPGNITAQAARGTSEAWGLRPHKNHEPCKGDILRVATAAIAPFQGFSHFPGATRGCATASLSPGFYIAGPWALMDDQKVGQRSAVVEVRVGG